MKRKKAAIKKIAKKKRAKAVNTPRANKHRGKLLDPTKICGGI